MSESKNTRLIRQMSVGIVIGLILGVIIGLLVGWVLWPVEYQQASTYQLVDEEKQQYVAAVVDSYNLTKQLDVAQQRFSTWTTDEKVSELARLSAEYQAQGKTQEAQQVAALAAELQRVEGWDPAVVSEVSGEVANQYQENGEPNKADAVSQFASALGAAAPPPAAGASPAATTGPQTPAALGGSRWVLAICGVLLLAGGLIVLILVVFGQRRAKEKPAAGGAEPEWTGSGPPPLLQRTSSYTLSMDNFDESFAIETDENEWLGECGMGISESLDEGTPRRVTAFEVWLFDKPNTRTVTKVLMSDYASNNEALRNKLASRGEPVLATPGGTFSLETPDLVVEAEIVEMEYGDDTPAFGYFNNLSVVLTARQKSEPDESGDIA
jgi:hypothetical protein